MLGRCGLAVLLIVAGCEGNLQTFQAEDMAPGAAPPSTEADAAPVNTQPPALDMSTTPPSKQPVAVDMAQSAAAPGGPGDGGAPPDAEPPRLGTFGPQVPAQCAGQSGLQAGSPWPMSGHDSARSNRTDAVGPSSLSLQASAAIAGHAGGPWLNNLAVASDGTLYLTDANGVHAFDAALTPQWTYPTGSRLPHSPAVRRDGSIVFTSTTMDNTTAAVFALSPDGTLLWITNLTSSVPAALGTITSAASVGCDQSLYLAAFGNQYPTDPQLIALSADGTPKWKWSQPGLAWMPRLGPLDTVYAAGPTVINPDGSPFYITNGDCAFVDHIAPDGTLFSGATACAVDGWQKWAAPFQYYGDGAVAADGTLLLPGSSVTAIDESGAVRWQSIDLPLPSSCGAGISSNPVLDGQGLLYFATGQTGYHCGSEGTDSAPPTETLFVVDANGGALRSTVDLMALAGCRESQELAIGRGQLYALCLDRIIALGD